MNWFRSKALGEEIIDLDFIISARKMDYGEGDLLIEFCFCDDVDVKDSWKELLYNKKEERDLDYDRLCKQLMKITIVGQRYSWSLDVKDLAQYRLSKEKEK
jgi:hypothetical protein